MFYIFIIKIIIDAFRRKSNHKYFKNNVVINKGYDLYLNSKSKEKNNIYFDVSKEKLKMFNTDDIDSLKNYFYDIFLKFETAYNNLDYNTIKIVSTKQLFQNYYTGITLDLKVGRKRIIENIKKRK